MPTLHRTIPLGLAAGCLAALAVPTEAPAAGETVASLRARGPAALASLLARYDRLPAGASRDELAMKIDAVAGQRYATVSRLYWYTDLDRAKAAARERQRPILALRMLGRLDEELSCANSRLFRSTLYANTEIAGFLRDHFVLYWSAERPVPKVTIDFGDGRKLERTTTGNSAHYVLDARGHVLDVLPGLYAPIAFRAELAKSLRLAETVRTLDDRQRIAATIAFHEAGAAAAQRTYASVAGTKYIRTGGRLLAAGEFGAAAVRRAQMATMSKMRMEVPDLAAIGFEVGSIPADDVTQWATIGQQVWQIGTAAPTAQANAKPLPRASRVTPPRVLDDRSRALVRRLHTANGVTAQPYEIDAMIARLEQTIVADTALNQFRLRQQIRGEIIARRDLDFASLNTWIYANVFHTPREDAWLGLLPRTDFTGLPGDGVVMR